MNRITLRKFMEQLQFLRKREVSHVIGCLVLNAQLMFVDRIVFLTAIEGRVLGTPNTLCEAGTSYRTSLHFHVFVCLTFDLILRGTVDGTSRTKVLCTKNISRWAVTNFRLNKASWSKGLALSLLPIRGCSS